ncbi:GPI-anchor transamidase subunit [Saccharomycopsis crataegensis]|uniref:GPI-anchor transamidase subunit n=1 Tax=Saccharomycopsis crataegensis TaxID=43959 RepID=A0AAV5QDQ2_9ASCO|nr:GPI-anchor transamidase subunit [Saccharomycopsis crataegensis]
MALLEVLQRKIHKYGLVPKLIKALPIISLVCALVGTGWILYLPIDGQYRKTYISENALMPSQAYSYYRESEWNFLRGYRDELHNLVANSTIERNAEVKNYLTEAGYTAAEHHYTPSNANESGSNVYGILNAPRGDGTEAMVIVAPWTTSDGTYNENGIALAMGMARYFARWTIWSKNIILVIPENNQFALRSWVKSYHSSLDLTAGSIEAALVIEYPGSGDYYDYLEVSYEGVNGQLPNLDLLNTAISISEHEGMKVSLQKTPKDQIGENTYWSRLTVLFNGIKALALAGLKRSNGCEVFSGYRIQAITLRAVGDNGSVDITTLGRVIEATFRSVNNLLEKFHQSFFFYLMLAPRNFISIGTYLPSAVFFSVAFALAALSEILNCGLPLPVLVGSGTKVLLTFLSITASSLLLGSLVLFFPVPASLIYYTFLIFGLIVASLPTKQLLLAALARPWGKSNPANPYIQLASSAHLLHAVCLLYASLIITSILVVNFSLAYTMSICMLPLTFVRPITLRSSNYQENINAVSLLLSCPFFIVLLIGILDGDFTNGPVEVMQGLLTSWKDFDCWTWSIVIVGWIPVWIGSAVCGSLIVDESEYGVVDLKKDL